MPVGTTLWAAERPVAIIGFADPTRNTNQAVSPGIRPRRRAIDYQLSQRETVPKPASILA